MLIELISIPRANEPLDRDKLRRERFRLSAPWAFPESSLLYPPASTGNLFIYCCLIIYTHAVCIPSYLHCQVMCIEAEALLSPVLLLVSSPSVCLTMT